MPKRKKPICPAFDDFMADRAMPYGARMAAETYAKLRPQIESARANVAAVLRIQAELPPSETFTPDTLETALNNITRLCGETGI
jgi:hypothetical protein